MYNKMVMEELRGAVSIGVFTLGEYLKISSELGDSAEEEERTLQNC